MTVFNNATVKECHNAMNISELKIRQAQLLMVCHMQL